MDNLFKGDDTAKFFRWGSWAFLILTIFLAVQTLGAVKGLRSSDPARNTISVTGEGEVVTIPDIAMLHFSVSADAEEVSAAQTEVTEKMDAILVELKEMGIEEKDIKTSNYSVYPNYTYQNFPCTPTSCPPSRQVSNGYTVSHDVSVKIRQTEQAGEVLSMLGDNGATNVSNITFTTDEPEELVEEARALAIRDAREKAEALAEELGVRLVRVASYSDSNYGGYPMPVFRQEVGNDMGMGSASAPSLPTGENKIQVNVTVTYEIR